MRPDTLPSSLEEDFIRDCLAAQLFPGRSLPDPSPALDWTRLYHRLALHRLTAYFHALTKDRQLPWPANVREHLRQDRYSLMLYGDGCSLRVQRLLSALTGAGIRVIVMKGWAHIQTVYGGDHSQRVCEDIDILVHPRDVRAAEQVLHDLGCLLDPEAWPGYNHRYMNGARYYFPQTPGDPANTFSVGFHWGLWHLPAYESGLVDMDALFSRAHPLTVAGVPALELSAEDSVVYTCGHLGLHHRFDPALFRYYELAVHLRDHAQRLDWARVAERASQWRTILPVRVVLAQTALLWPGLVPRSAFDALDQAHPSAGERFVNAWVVLTRGRSTFDHLLTWLTFPDWKQRPLIFLQDVFPGPDYLNYRYGRAPLGLWPIWYLRRFLSGLAFLFKGWTLRRRPGA